MNDSFPLEWKYDCIMDRLVIHNNNPSHNISESMIKNTKQRTLYSYVSTSRPLDTLVHIKHTQISDSRRTFDAEIINSGGYRGIYSHIYYYSVSSPSSSSSSIIEFEHPPLQFMQTSWHSKPYFRHEQRLLSQSPLQWHLTFSIFVPELGISPYS